MQKSRRLKLSKLFVAAGAKLLEGETSLEDLAYARCPPEHACAGTGEEQDWDFFEGHYKRLVQLAIAWSGAFGKRNPVAPAEFTFHCESGTKELVTELASYGGTHLTLAAVWYLLVCHVGGFGTSTTISFKSDWKHKHLYWWLAHQLLIFSSTGAVDILDSTAVIDLPWPSNQPGGAGPGQGALEEAKRTAAMDTCTKRMDELGSYGTDDRAACYNDAFYTAMEAGDDTSFTQVGCLAEFIDVSDSCTDGGNGNGHGEGEHGRD